ncbi:MAG TPA: PAS domain S-box protein [Acidobacteriaceae bacterium]|nr:PAS domain S-box protein [Acidobacteriaceae bacterium]
MALTFNGPDSLHQKLELVAHTGLLLARNAQLEAITQRATDAALQLTGAEFGSFVCNQSTPHAGSYVFYTVSGTGTNRSSTFPAHAALAAPLKDRTIIRSRDIGRDTRFRGPIPGDGLPHETRTIRSYLVVPVRNLTGEILGAFVLGHEEPDVFDETAELLICTLASQTAVAIENARARTLLSRQIGDLDRVHAQMNVDAKRLGELAAIVEGSDDAIISKDLDGVITSWNKAAQRILGYTADEIIGKSVLTLIPEHLQGDEPVIISKISAGERIEHFETVRRTKSGELLDVSLTISPIRDASGQIVGASKILRDFSHRKRIENSLIQAEKIAATGRMAATIAHEINNPLEAVLNLLYLMRPLVEGDGKTYLSTAEIELNRVAHIAKQTLGYYREHSSAVCISLAQLVDHALAVYSPRCSAYNIEVERCVDSSAKIVVRRGEMMQVISNLLANAIYAMGEGGRLSVCLTDVQTPAPGVLLTIADNGVGIPQENLSKVFEAFFTTRLMIGTGIGLFVAKQFVEGHGGQIGIESSTDPEKHGTKVSVFLPLHTIYEKTLDPAPIA